MQKIFWVITFFGFSLALGMEEVPDIETIQSYIDNAQNASTLEEKLKWYGKIVNITGTLNKEQYAFRSQALDFMYEEAKKLRDQGEYKGALKVYGYAPQLFSNEINVLQKLVPFQAQIQQAVQQNKFDDIYKILESNELRNIREVENLVVKFTKKEQDYYYNEALQAAKSKNRKKELEWLGKILDMSLPYLPHIKELKNLQDFRLDVWLRLEKEASHLINEGAYDKALEIYRSAPRSFKEQIRPIEVFERLQQVVQQKKYEEAFKIFSTELKPLLYYAPETLQREIEKLEPLIEIQYYMQKAKELGENKEALEWYGKVAGVSFPNISSLAKTYADVRLLREEAINKVSQAAVDLKNRGDYKEARKIYNYAPQVFSVQIAALDDLLPYQTQIAQAKQSAKENKFTEALGIIANQLKDIKNLPEIIRLKATIEAQKQEWERKQKPPEQKKWIFLRPINKPENLEPSDWHIIGMPPDARLELSAEAADPITTEKFVELIEEAQKKKKPYILFGLRSSDGFYHFVDDSYLQEILKKWKNPVSKTIDAIEIFVVGDNGKFTFLDEMKQGDAIFNYFTAQFSFFPSFDKKLQNSGEGHLIIANLFKQKAEKNLASKEGQIALQYARQWYDWAMNYLSPGSFEYTQAKKERDAIPYKPEILPKEQQQEIPGSLMQALQNLTRSLRGVEVKLH